MGVPIWASEDGPAGTDWNAALRLAALLNRNFITGQITKTEIWSLIAAHYPSVRHSDNGLMRANSPWSGAYSVSPALWAIAHTTQFTRPGWRYFGEQGCGLLSDGGSWVALLSEDKENFSIIIETSTAKAVQKLTFQLEGGLSTKAITIWKSVAADFFKNDGEILMDSNSISFVARPECIYSLTTTKGQTK